MPDAKTLKKMPVLLTDEEAEEFVAHADLTEYDLSGFRPMTFEFPDEEERLLLSLPKRQIEALKLLAKKQDVSYDKLVRQLIDRALKAEGV